jgi:outer membrane lipopolysaccharide assembly protein LptE/RlpB
MQQQKINFKNSFINKLKLFSLSILLLMMSACGIYSFTGASISPETKTVAVYLFQNNSNLVVPTLSQTITESLKDRIVTQTNLQLTRNAADIEFEGKIIDYSVRPMTVQGNNVTSQNRLSISVKVKYTNKKEEAKSFEYTFTRYADFPGTKNLPDVESELIKIISTQLIDDIFNKAFVNW